jgi:hypothetical protein
MRLETLKLCPLLTLRAGRGFQGLPRQETVAKPKLCVFQRGTAGIIRGELFKERILARPEIHASLIPLGASLLRVGFRSIICIDLQEQ